MSYPNIVWGSFGDEKVAQSTKIGSLPLGTRMILPDGREFAHAKMSATAGVAGDLYMVLDGIQATDVALRKDGVITAGGASGSTSVTVTAGATTAVTKDQFEDGYFFINDVTGQGECYKIKENTSAAAGSAITITLYGSDTFQTTLAAGTSQCGVAENEFYQLTVNTADTVRSGHIAGILPVAASANFYCWVQRKGICAALTDGTLVIGLPCVPSTALAGAVGPVSAATTLADEHQGVDHIGYVKNVAASTEYSLIYLNLP